MQIYLAARFGRWAEMEKHADMLAFRGYSVVSRWHTGAHVNGVYDAAPSDEQAASWAQEDMEDLKRAECIINFTEEPRSAEGGRGGRHVEFGLALGLGKRLIVVGPKEHVFHRLPDVEHFEDWCALLAGMHRAAPKEE